MKSSGDHSTLYQLRNAINRTNVSKPDKDYNACDDFFGLVLDARIVLAAMNLLKMSAPEGQPTSRLIGDIENMWMEDDDKRREILSGVALKVVDTFTDIMFLQPSRSSHGVDKVNMYAKQLLSLGCLYAELVDGIREGDGNRVIRCWRYLLPVFISSGRTNYANESFKLLMQHDFLLPPRQAAELNWSRFINVHGIMIYTWNI